MNLGKFCLNKNVGQTSTVEFLEFEAANELFFLFYFKWTLKFCIILCLYVLFLVKCSIKIVGDV